ncbi:hypothetical protein J2X85_000039 [Microbacterium trichothecenolyticum]|uniref:hypothetical protein n=1 Tax=Microbacterium trichothecenolyticum TaxID=69370 RepID=UPI0028575611|nr:hypothetical protein [Microbacterium trichothecenolyticum]MDR7183016.1 hypothetical protein [Microbacterium trichothecenolyticum]
MADTNQRGPTVTATWPARVAVAVVVALLTGCSATTDADVIVASASPTDRSEEELGASGIPPSPTPTMPPESCEPAEFPRASLPPADAPAPGVYLTLEPDPCLTVKSLLGWYMWLEEQGIDADLIQGFQSVAGLEPWIAPLADGSGRCIVMGSSAGGSGAVACDSAGAAAKMERSADGSVLRFVIDKNAIAVSAAAP